MLPKAKPIGPEAILQKKKKYMIPCVYHFYKEPPQIVRGEGVYVYDSKGKRYMDLYSGVSVHALGHCHPELTEAICQQVRTLQHTTTIYLTEPIVNLAEKLASLLPGDINRTFFCCSGSEANEGAALLATLYTGRNDFLSLQNSLHGRTKLGMSLTGLEFWRTDPDPVSGITHIPAPKCIQCPFGQMYGQCKYECVDAVERAIQTSTSGKPAAMFVEPVQGNGGIIVPPPEYFPKLRQLLDRYEMLLIADEVQTGFGRTGHIFSMNHWNVVPDIITGGKALGGGMPIGFFSTSDKIADSYTRPGASTFGGNPVTAQAALAFLNVLIKEEIVEKVKAKGYYLKAQLEKICSNNDFICDVRGLGLMIGLEISGKNENDGVEITDNLLENMKDRGFLLGKTGPDRNVLTFMPPLIIERNQLDLVVEALNAVLMDLA